MTYGLLKHKEKNPKNVVGVPSRKLAQLKHMGDNLNAQRYWNSWSWRLGDKMKQEAHGSQRSRTDCHSKLEKINLSLYQNFEYYKKFNFLCWYICDFIMLSYICDFIIVVMNSNQWCLHMRLKNVDMHHMLHEHDCSWQDPIYMYMIMKKIKSQYALYTCTAIVT